MKVRGFTFQRKANDLQSKGFTFQRKANDLQSKGFSLVETLLVVFVAGLLVFLMANLPNAFNLIAKSKNASIAREIAIKQIEDKRSIGFDNLAIGTETISDSRISLLPGATGSLNVEDCPAQICTNGEQIKLVTALVLWKEGGKEQKVELKTLIGLGGLN